MPKISIITTTYKHQDFIKETIESILYQTYTDWEILIGDDSPDDKTWNIIQGYTNEYPDKIKAWHHNPNKGIVDNMNFLIEKVSNESEYIAFLEGDDMFTSDNLEEKIKIFEKYSEVGMVYNNLDFINEKGEVFYKNYLQQADKILKNEKLKLEKFINGGLYYGSYSSLMFRKFFLNKFGIKNLSEKFIASDWILFGETANKYNIYGVEKSLTLYRRHNGNLTKELYNLSKDLIMAIEYFKKNNLNLNVDYRLNHLKTYINYLEKNKLETIKYGLLSFKYSLNKNFMERVGMILFSLLPNKFDNYLYNKFKK